MNKKALYRIGVIGLILAVGLIAFFAWPSKPTTSPNTLAEIKAKPTPSANPPTSYGQLPAADPNNYNPNLPQWQEWRRRNTDDPKWEWKVPIAFYGQVLDQNDAPVKQAKVTLSWTDLSTKGVSLREITTDEEGGFSLDNAKGKHLLVRSIEKSGYKYGGQKQNGFEYAAFFDAEYYTPDAKFPVIFRMHKQGGAEPLVVISTKYRIPADNIVVVDLRTGRQGGNDIAIEFVNNSDVTGRKWAAKVKALTGGLQVANIEFSSEAPESGYEPEIALDQDTPNPPGFPGGSLYKGGKFYVKTASGYALVQFRMVPGNKSFYFTSYLNPNPSSRNLEFDPARQIKTP